MTWCIMSTWITTNRTRNSEESFQHLVEPGHGDPRLLESTGRNYPVYYGVPMKRLSASILACGKTFCCDFKWTLQSAWPTKPWISRTHRYVPLVLYPSGPVSLWSFLCQQWKMSSTDSVSWEEMDPTQWKRRRSKLPNFPFLLGLLHRRTKMKRCKMNTTGQIN